MTHHRLINEHKHPQTFLLLKLFEYEEPQILSQPNQPTAPPRFHKLRTKSALKDTQKSVDKKGWNHEHLFNVICEQILKEELRSRPQEPGGPKPKVRPIKTIRLPN
jgi:hypothetical protein